MINIAVVTNLNLVNKCLAECFKDSEVINVAATFTALDDFINYNKKKPVNILLIDLKLNAAGVLTDIQMLTDQFARLKIIVFTSEPETLFGLNARRAGAMGYCNMSEEFYQLESKILQVADNQLAFVVKDTNQYGRAPKGLMSKRESEVYEMLASGLNNKEIGEALGLNDKTISTYKLRLLRKFRATGTVELIRNVNAKIKA